MRSLAYMLSLAFIFAVPWQSAVHLRTGSLSKAVGIAAALVWLLSVVERGSLRPLHRLQKAYFLFLVWNGLTIYWSIATGISAHGFLTYLQIFVLLVVVWDLYDNESKIESALQAYVLGAWISAISIVVNYLTAPAARFPGHVRLKGIGDQVDGIALVIAIGIPAAWYLASSPSGRRRPKWLRIVSYLYVPVAVFAMLLTGTRGAVLASIPTAMLLLWSLRRTSPLTRLAAVSLIAAVVVLIVIAPQGQLSRIATVTSVPQLGSKGGALTDRWEIWVQSRDAFAQRPIFGSGLDTHREAVAIGREAHNTYISVLVETGLVGFVLFAGVLFSIYSEVVRRTGWEAWYWLTQLGVLALGAMSLSLEDNKPLWILTSLAVSSAALAMRPETVTEVSPAVLPARARPVRLSPTFAPRAR